MPITLKEREVVIIGGGLSAGLLARNHKRIHIGPRAVNRRGQPCRTRSQDRHLLSRGRAPLVTAYARAV